jgi:NADH-quinone oxidoreductase subunit K
VERTTALSVVITYLRLATGNDSMVESIVTAVPLWWVLTLAAALFCIGLYGALTRRNAIGMLLGVELMLNAVNINLIAFWRYFEPNAVAGQVFALFVIIVAACEAAVGLAMAISIARTRGTINADEIDTLRG